MKCFYPYLSALLLIVGGVSAQTDGTWDTPNSDPDYTGNWSDSTQWLDGIVASGTDATATIEYVTGGSSAADDATISLDSPFTIGHIIGNGTGSGGTHNYTINGPSILTLDVTSGFASITNNMSNGRELTLNTVLDGDDGLDLTVTTDGDIVLNGANTYEGETQIDDGVIQVGNNSAFGSTTDTTGTNSGITRIISASAAIELLDGVVVNAGETLYTTGNGTGSNFGALHVTGGASAEWAGDIVMDGGTRFGTQGGATLEVSGTISGSNDLSLSYGNDSETQGTLILSGANTYTGSTTIFRGTMQLADGDNRLPTSTIVQLGQVSTDSTLDLNGTNQSLAGIYNNTGGASTRTLTNTDSGNASVLTLTGSTDRSMMAGGDDDTILSGNLSIVQNGNSNFTLAETNTFTGNVTVNDGTVTLADGSTITIYIGNNGVNNGFYGTGAVVLDGSFIFDLTGADGSGGNSWTVVGSNLAETYGATFAVQDFTEEGAGIWTSGDYTFDQSTGVLSTVPEPSAFAAVLGGASLLLILRRRR